MAYECDYTEQWVCEEWVTDTRYYLLELKQDLFGHWLCCQHWRGLHHKGGRQMVTLFEDYDKAEQALQDNRKRRRYRGYRQKEQYT